MCLDLPTTLSTLHTPIMNSLLNEMLPSFGVCALISAGGVVRLHLPPSISTVPITFHTLAAVLSGMIFGPNIGAYGAFIHLAFFSWYHKPPPCRTDHSVGTFAKFRYFTQSMPSLGYIIGMIPCAYVSGALHFSRNEGSLYSTALDAAVAQGATVICGVAWLYLAFPEESLGALIAQNALPFIPGLFVKSFMAWIVVSYLGSL